MIRHIAAVVVVLCLSASAVFAQSVTFTVHASSASVYNGPSTAALVIGQAKHDAVLQITRELGSWVRVVWPSAKDGVGYVHVSTGSIARGTTAPGPRPASATTPAPGPSTLSAMLDAANGSAKRGDDGVQTNGAAPAPLRATYIAPPMHRVGVGGGIGGTSVGVGASARAWTRNRLGVQFVVSHIALTSIGSTEHVSTMRVAPSVLWSGQDLMSDYVWVRPYVGGGPTFYRSTLAGGPLSAGASMSDGGLGAQTFGGGEFTFAGVPRFALSAELGYRWSGTPFPGFDLNGLALSVSGHWYVK